MKGREGRGGVGRGGVGRGGREVMDPPAPGDTTIYGLHPMTTKILA